MGARSDSRFGSYRVLFDALPVPVVVTSLSGTARYANPAYLRLVGARRPDDVLGHTIKERLHPEELDKARRNVEVIAAGGDPPDDPRFRMLHQDGSWLPVDVFAIRTEFEGETALFSLIIDARAEESARQTVVDLHRTLRDLIDAMPIAASVTDEDGVIIHVNDAAMRLFGAEAETDLVGIRAQDLLPPDELERTVAELARRDRRRDRRYRHLRLDGSEGQALIFGHRLRFEGAPAILSLFVDVTESESQRRALAAAEARYRTLIENSPDAVIVHVDGHIVFANPAAATLAGVPDPEALHGRTPFGFLDAPSRELATLRRNQLAASGGTLPAVEETVLRADGSRVRVEVMSSAVEFDGCSAIQSIVRDLTPRDAERAARMAAESRAAAIVSSIPVGMHFWRLDASGTLRFDGANPAADAILGIEHAALIGMSMAEAFPMLADTPIPERYETVIRTGEDWANEDVYYDEAGRITGSYDVRAFRTAPDQMVATFADITVRKQAEAAIATHQEHLEREVAARTADLMRSNRELAEATRAKNAFLASMSHELRTPLNSIIGFSGLLSQGMVGPLSAEQERQVRMINRSGRQLLTLVGDVLDLARIESGRVDLESAPLALGALICALCDTVTPMCTARGLTLDCAVPDPDITIVADRLKVEQILLNLLSNAIKFTREGRIGIEAVATPDAAFITVWDTGSGIPPEERSRIFEEFHQVASPQDPREPGTGLGLAIAKHLAELMGGSISLESVVGEGSRFTLRLPLEPPTGTCGPAD